LPPSQRGWYTSRNVKPLYYQMVSTIRRYDAVGRMSWAMHCLFESWGAGSLIFTEKQKSPGIGPLRFGPLRNGILAPSNPWDGLAAPDFCVYQHSIGSKVADRFLEWPAKRRVLIYQNITPSDGQAVSEAARRDRDWGRHQLKRLVEGSDLQIALSEYSAADLRAHGATRLLKLPYLEWKRDIEPGTSDRGLEVLMVARVVPHKGVLEAIRAIARLRERRPSATLTVLGSLRGDEKYVREVRETIDSLGLRGAVTLKGRVSDRALVRHYRRAGALLSLSRHEGFCVPLVEAIRARTPIVALGAAAVPETLGKGGLTLRTDDPAETAEALDRIFSDGNLRRKLAEAQAKEQPRFSRAAFAGPLSEALASL